MLGSVDVDLNDPLIQAALAQLEGATGTTSKDESGATSKKRKNEGNDRGDNDS